VIARLSLRSRVTLAFGIMGLVLSIGFAALTTFVADDYEDILVDALMDGQADTYLKAVTQNPEMALPRSPEFSVYRQAEAPLVFRGLDPGSHEMDLPGHEGVHVGVYAGRGQRLVFVIDAGRIETLESYIERVSLIVVFLGAILSAWFGWLLAAKTISPVIRLAKAVESLPLTPVATNLAAGHGRDEIGRLAGAVDAYQQRLVDADANERRFFADASHELRTPIAVIQGAVEVLKDDPETSAGQKSKLSRIDRSILELATLLEALLLSARGLPDDVETIDLHEICQRSLERITAADPERLRTVELRGTGPENLRGHRRWISAIFDVLFQRMLTASPGATWRVDFSGSGVTISQPVSTQTDAESIRRSDLGIGIVFVERLSRRLGWVLTQRISPNDGLRICIEIP